MLIVFVATSQVPIPPLSLLLSLNRLQLATVPLWSIAFGGNVVTDFLLRQVPISNSQIQQVSPHCECYVDLRVSDMVLIINDSIDEDIYFTGFTPASSALAAWPLEMS